MEPIYNGQIGVSAFCPLWRGLLDEGLICIITLVHIRASVTCPLHGGAAIGSHHSNVYIGCIKIYCMIININIIMIITASH